MAEVVKIVLTGGPCAGKTTALHFLKESLEKINIKVYALEEVAGRLMSEGITPQRLGIYEFHKHLFETQLREEKILEQKASAYDGKKAVILLDRGLLDSKAYVTDDEFIKYISASNQNEDIIRNSYDAVFHLKSVALYDESIYRKNDNEVRKEDACLAGKIDERLLSVWTGTAHLRVIKNNADFDKKLNDLLKEVMGFLGEPEPLEIERKFLIEYPDIDFLNSISTCRKVSITQAYLHTPEEGIFRIRKRGSGEDAVYIKTVKIKINDLKRIEKETYLTESEYTDYLNRKECITGIISKDRYCIVYDDSYYELDVYPFWTDRATLEIELLSEEQPYKLPPFVRLIREVSHEPEYRNFALAQRLLNNQHKTP